MIFEFLPLTVTAHLLPWSQSWTHLASGVLSNVLCNQDVEIEHGLFELSVISVMFPDLWCCDESSCVGEACIQVTPVHCREEAGIWFTLFLSVILTYFISFNVFEKILFHKYRGGAAALKNNHKVTYSTYILLQFLKWIFKNRIF